MRSCVQRWWPRDAPGALAGGGGLAEREAQLVHPLGGGRAPSHGTSERSPARGLCAVARTSALHAAASTEAALREGARTQVACHVSTRARSPALPQEAPLADPPHRHQRLRLARADVAQHAHLCVPPPRLRGCWSGAFAAPCPPPTPPLRKRLAWPTHCASRSSRSTPRCPRAARPAPRATTWPGAPLIYAPQRTHHALTASRHAALRRLCSAHDTVVPARGKALVKTDLSIAIPEGTYARIAPRSGLAWKNFIDTGAGVRWLSAPCFYAQTPRFLALRL